MRKGIPTIVMQNEVSECGLACIAMLANYHGIDAPLEKLRDRYPVSVHGSTLSRLGTILSDVGIPGIPVQFDFNELNALPLPAILHYGAGHYVVLAWRSGDRVCVLNPALGAQMLSFDALKQEISGYALIVEEGEKIAPKAGWVSRAKQPRLPAWISVKATSAVPYVYRLMLSTFAISLAVFIIPAIMSSSLNSLYNHSGPVEVPWKYYIFAFFAIAGVELLNGIFSANVIKHFSHTSSAKGFMRLMQQPLRYYHKRNSGEIYSRFTHWCGALNQKITLDNTLRIDWVVAVIAFGVMFWVSPLLSLISFLSVIVMGLISLWATYRDRVYTQKIEILGAEQNDFIMETISGIHTIKSAGLQTHRQVEFAAQNHQMLKLLRDYAVYNKVKNTLYQLTNNGEMLLFIAISLPLIQSGAMNLGAFVSYGLVKQIYGNTMTRLFFTALQKNEISVIDKRADDFLHCESLLTQSQEKTECFSHSIQMNDLCFGWNAQERLFNGLTMSLRKGECLAIVGPSGEGKTTFLSIAAGLLAPESGSLSIDGIEQTPGQWASMAFMNSTDHILLQGDVRDNITLFKSTGTAGEERQIWQILSALGIAEAIENLPGGLNARIREGNSTLSAGQRQRLLLARAFYCHHELIILDEPTANLDHAAAQQTMTAILAQCRQQNKTLIVVTHNLSLLGDFDAVYRLSGGGLVPQGRDHAH